MTFWAFLAGVATGIAFARVVMRSELREVTSAGIERYLSVGVVFALPLIAGIYAWQVTKSPAVLTFVGGMWIALQVGRWMAVFGKLKWGKKKD